MLLCVNEAYSSEYSSFQKLRICRLLFIGPLKEIQAYRENLLKTYKNAIVSPFNKIQCGSFFYSKHPVICVLNFGYQLIHFELIILT